MGAVIFTRADPVAAEEAPTAAADSVVAAEATVVADPAVVVVPVAPDPAAEEATVSQAQSSLA
jgi:hypothetical protein